MRLTNELVKKYERLIDSIVRRYLPRHRKHEQEDIKQSVWVSLTEKLGEYDGRIPLTPYISIHARWAAMNASKRGRFDSVSEIEQSHNPREAQEREMDAHALLGRLPEAERRDVVRLMIGGDTALGTTREGGRQRKGKIISRLKRIAREPD